MKKILLLAVFFSIQLLGLKALASDNNNRLFCTPTITTGTISPITICAGSIISVPFTFTDCVDPSNVFTVQLSDASGSFASPTNIGSAAGTTAGSIIAIIPPNINFGSAYRIRVVSSSPLVNGADNGIDLTLLPKPSATFSINNISQCINGNSFTYTNTSTGSITSYNWNLGDGITTSQTNVTYTYALSNNYNVTLTATGTNGCKDSVTHPVTVLAKPVANFTFSGPDLCSNTLFNFQNTTASSVAYTSYWAYSDGDTSTQQNPSHTFAAAGSYTVKLVVQNGNNCKDSITKTVSVLDKPTASFLVNNPTQCFSSNSFSFPNFSTGVGNTYFWDFEDGTSSTVTNATKTYASSGVYVVKLVVTNINGCKDSTTQTISVTDNPISNFSINGNSLCAANLTVNFNNSSTGAGNTYLWNFGDGNSATATNPTNIYSSIGTYNVKLVATNADGCKDSITQSITIGSKPTADYSVNNSTQCLSGNLFTFTNTTSGTFTSSLWYFGDGITSSFTNPSKAYTIAGTYNVKLVVANGSGCSDSITKTVVVADNPVAKFTVAGNTSCSSTLNISLNNTSTGVGNTYLWYFGDGNTSSATNPSYTYSTGGSYIIRLVVTNSMGCKDSTERSVTFASKPTAAFTVDVNSQCLGTNTFTFTNNSVGGVMYLWDFGDGFTSNATSPTKSYTASGAYTVKLVVTNASGCKDSITQLVTVLAKPVAGFTTIGAANCSPTLTVGFTNTSTGTNNTYLWNFGTSATDTSSAVNPSNVYATTGVYTVKLVATNLNGCKDSISQTITLSAKSIASFSINSASQCGNNNNFIFTNTSTGTVVSNFWDFGDGFTSTAINPTKNYTNTGTYTVTLIVTNANGCKDTTTKTVTLLTVPTAAFTISGSTGCTNNLTIGLNNTSTGSGLTYAWNFGDATTSNIANPTKSYSTSNTYTVKLLVTNSNGCKDSAVETITFKPRPNAGLISLAAATQCLKNNSYQFTDASTGSPASYYWDFGNGSTSTQQNPPAYSYSTAGTYTVLHVATNTAGCSDSTTSLVTVNASPNAGFAINYQGCSRTVTFVPTQTSGNSSSWTFGDGNTSTSFSGVTNTYGGGGGGTYAVRHILILGSCTDTSTQTVQFTSKPIAGILRTGAPLIDCYNRGNNSFDYVSNSQFENSYLWDFGNGLTSTLQNPAPIAYAAVGTYTVKLVVTNSQGCKDSTTTLADVRKSPVGNIRITSGATGCTNNLTIGLDDSLANDNIKSYTSWNFGDATISSQSNPIKTYSTQGTYTITMITGGSNASGTNGCVDTTTKVVSFLKRPNAGIDFAANHTQCIKGNSYGLLSSSVGATSLLWDFGDGFTSAADPVTHAYTTVGTYTIKLIATAANGCKDTTNENATILISPDASFTAYYDPCNNLTAYFLSPNMPPNSDAGTSKLFTFSDGGANSATHSINHTFPAVGSHTATYEVLLANGCKDVSTQTVVFGANPVLNITTSTPTTQCFAGNSFTFADLSNPTSTHNWILGDGNTKTGTTPASFSYATSGTYSIKEIVTTTLGCKDSATVNVTVLPSPVAAFTNSTQVCTSLDIQFIQTTTIPTNSGVWYFGDGNISTTPYLVSHTYTNPGTYTVKYVAFDATSTCKDSATKTIVLDALLASSFTINNNSQCVNTNNFIFTNTSTGAIGYTWNFGDGATSTIASPTHTYTATGVYAVQLIASNGTCNDTTTVSVTVNDKPSASFTYSGSTNCTNNLTLGFNSSSIATSTYAWSFGDGTTSNAVNPTKTYLSTGTYTVKLIETNIDGCKDSTIQTITFSTPITPVFSVNNSTQCINSNNFIFTNNTLGANVYNWNFGDGSTSNLVSPTHIYTSAGVYNVKLIITNTTGCIDSLSATVTVNAQPVATFTHTGATNCTNNLTLSFNSSSIATSTYAWSFGDGTTSTANNPIKTYLATGTYSVKLVETNANGCKDSTTQTVIFSNIPTALFTVNNSTQCVNGNNFSFTNNSVNGASYLWSFGDGTTSTLSTPNHSYSTAGVFVVKLFVTNASGCVDSTTTSLTVSAKPSAGFTSTGATTCTNNLTLVFTNTSLGAASYLWSFGDGTTSTATNPVKTYLSTGTYTIKLVETNTNGCKDSTAQTVTFSNIPTATFTVNNNTQCVNENSFSFTNNSTNATVYTWSFGDGATSASQNPTHTYTTAGIYTVKLLATNIGGCVDSTTALITVNAKPTALYTYTGNTACTSNLTLVFANASVGAVSNSWDFGDGTVSTAVNPTKTYSAIGSYTVKLVTTNANGCKDSTTQTVTFSNVPVAAFNVVGSATCSSSLGIVLNNTSTGNIASYAWDFGDGTISLIASPTKLYTTAGTYTIKLVVTSVNGCKDSASQTINASTKPAASFTIPTFDSCSNTFSINITNTSANANTYAWSFGDGTTSIATSPSKTYTSAGTYTIKLVAVNTNGCKDSATTTITLLPKPVANFTSNASTLCLGNNIVFTNTSSSLSTSSYYWDFGDGTTSLLQNPTKVYITTGTFKVLMFVTNANGCKDSISKLLTITTKPIAAFSIPNYSSCSNGGAFSFTNTSSNAVNYLWDFGDGSGSTLQAPAHTYTTLGTYTITLVASNASGCNDTTKKSITLLSKPVAAYNVSNTSGCINTVFSFTDASSGLSTPAYHYWDFGDGTFSLLQNPTKAYSNAGNYKVILFVTNANGCKDSIVKTITVVAKPTVSFTIPNYSSCSGVNSFTFTNTSTNAVSYLWNFGDGTGSVLANPTKTYTTNGTYTITLIATTTSGCSDSAKQTITLLTKPTASFVVNSTSLCSTNSFVFTNTSTALASYYWDFGDGTFSLLQNPIKAFAATGNYKVLLTVTNANGCKDTTSKIITVISKPTAAFTVPSNSICSSNNTIVFANTSTNAISYVWDFGDGSGSTLASPTKTYANSGTYVVTLIANNANGCSDTVKQTISLYLKPIASFIVNNAGQCLNNNSFSFTNNSLNGISYLWDFGDGTFSALQNPVKVYSAVGNYNVTLTVTNSNNCTDVTTQAISVNPTMYASFTISGLSSCALGTTLTFVNNSVGGFNMPTNYWDFGDGTSSNVYSPTKVYTTPGTYTIRYTLIGRFCTDTTSQTITIQAKPTAAFAVSSNATQCLTGNVFSFANNSSGNVSTYYWEFGDGTTSAIANPTKSYTVAGNYIVKLTVTNAVGCTDVTTRTVVVTGKPIITYNINNATQCIFNNLFTFTNTSPNQTGTVYYWNFGDGILSTLPVINKSYAAVGTYNVTLIGTNGAGCIDSLTKTVTLVDKPTPSFTASSYNICSNNAITFTNNTSGNIASTVWKFGDGTSSTTLNPTHTYTNAGVYNVKLIVTNTAGCTDSITQTVVINPKPTASFTVQGNNQCVGAGSVAFTNTSTGVINNYAWNFGDSTGSTLANPVKIFTKAGAYNVKLIITTANGCIDSITQVVNVIAKPNASFAFNSISQCINNNSFNFSSVLAGLNSYIYQWDLGDGVTASTSSVTKSYSSVGSYNVKLLVVNTVSGCRDSVTQVVTVNPQPTATISGSGTICQGNTFVINATLTGTAPFSFTYTDGIKNYFVSGINTNLYGLSVSPTQTSTYHIVSMSDALCSASTAQLTSTSSVVTVDTTKFTKQPSNIVACIGNTVTFAPTISSGVVLGYQWQKNGVNIVGANATSLTLNNVTSVDSGTYRLVVTLPCGSIYSTNASLVVNAPAASPVFTSSVKYCQFDTSKPLVATGSILNWYTTATGGLASQTPPTPSTSIVGTQQYWVSNNTSVNCESPRYPITITVSAKPTVTFVAVGSTEILPTQTVLLKATASTNAIGIRWYYNSVSMGSMPLNQTTIGYNALGKYQVEAITAEGCTALSNVINVTGPIGYAQSTTGNNLRLYPNPATSVVNMYFDNPINEDATVRLVTATGQVLQSKVVKFVNKFQPVQMYIANLRADVYTVEVVNSKGISIARNLLIKAK